MLLAIPVGLFCKLARARQSSNHPPGFHHSYRCKDDPEGLMKRRHIRVLTSLNKTNFFLQKGNVHGFEYEQLKGYEKYLNQGIRKFRRAGKIKKIA
jgi:membrane-bound lytic murein transglycosylase MltF